MAFIQIFEFTFELAWKTLQDLFDSLEYKEVKGPKQVIRQAFLDKYVLDGEGWMEMLKDRNASAHEYDQTDSERIFLAICNLHYVNLRLLFERLQKDYTN